MSQVEERLHELIVWLEEVKGVKLNSQDVSYFRSVIKLATNDGYREAIGVTEDDDKGRKKNWNISDQ